MDNLPNEIKVTILSYTNISDVLSYCISSKNNIWLKSDIIMLIFGSMDYDTKIYAFHYYASKFNYYMLSLMSKCVTLNPPTLQHFFDKLILSINPCDTEEFTNKKLELMIFVLSNYGSSDFSKKMEWINLSSYIKSLSPLLEPFFCQLLELTLQNSGAFHKCVEYCGKIPDSTADKLLMFVRTENDVISLLQGVRNNKIKKIVWETAWDMQMPVHKYLTFEFDDSPHDVQNAINVIEKCEFVPTDTLKVLFENFTGENLKKVVHYTYYSGKITLEDIMYFDVLDRDMYHLLKNNRAVTSKYKLIAAMLYPKLFSCSVSDLYNFFDETEEYCIKELIRLFGANKVFNDSRFSLAGVNALIKYIDPNDCSIIENTSRYNVRQLKWLLKLQKNGFLVEINKLYRMNLSADDLISYGEDIAHYIAPNTFLQKEELEKFIFFPLTKDINYNHIEDTIRVIKCNVLLSDVSLEELLVKIIRSCYKFGDVSRCLNLIMTILNVIYSQGFRLSYSAFEHIFKLNDRHTLRLCKTLDINFPEYLLCYIEHFQPYWFRLDV